MGRDCFQGGLARDLLEGLGEEVGGHGPCLLGSVASNHGENCGEGELFHSIGFFAGSQQGSFGVDLRKAFVDCSGQGRPFHPVLPTALEIEHLEGRLQFGEIPSGEILDDLVEEGVLAPGGVGKEALEAECDFLRAQARGGVGSSLVRT